MDDIKYVYMLYGGSLETLKNNTLYDILESVNPCTTLCVRYTIENPNLNPNPHHPYPRHTHEYRHEAAFL